MCIALLYYCGQEVGQNRDGEQAVHMQSFGDLFPTIVVGPNYYNVEMISCLNILFVFKKNLGNF